MEIRKKNGLLNVSFFGIMKKGYGGYGVAVTQELVELLSRVQLPLAAQYKRRTIIN